MPATDPQFVEVLAHVCAATGVVFHLRVLAQQGSLTRQERRLVALLLCLGSLMLLRGAALSTRLPLLLNASLAVASVTPLVTFLFAEGLLRRHQPRVLKWIVLVGTAAGFLAAVTGLMHRVPRVLVGFGIFALLVQILVLVALLGRDRRDLTRTENGLADSLTVALVVIGPLFATDVLAGMGRHVVRLGSLGVLILVYASLQLSEKRRARRAAAFGILWALLVAAAFALGHSALLADHRPLTLVRSWVFFGVVVLLLLVFGQMRTLTGRTREANLLRTLASANVRTSEGLAHAIAASPNLGRHRLLLERDLLDHDAVRIIGLLDRMEGHVASLAQMRRTRRGSGEHVEAAERMADLLEANRMTHAVLLERDPAVVLCVQAPATGREELVRLELSLLARLAGAGAPS